MCYCFSSCLRTFYGGFGLILLKERGAARLLTRNDHYQSIMETLASRFPVN